MSRVYKLYVLYDQYDNNTLTKRFYRDKKLK